MKRYLIIFFVLGGCTSLPSIESETIIRLNDIIVHICPKGHHALPYPKKGLACKQNHIWVFGKKGNKGIVLDYYILGWEINRLLYYKNNKISNSKRR